jgi:hypothetical protein
MRIVNLSVKQFTYPLVVKVNLYAVIREGDYNIRKQNILSADKFWC